MGNSRKLLPRNQSTALLTHCGKRCQTMQVITSNLPNSEQLKKSQNKIQTIGSAPPLTNLDSKKDADENIRRTSSTVSESRIRCTITSERLAQLRKVVDDAIREHKIFTVRGGWQTLRQAFNNRGWIEKYEAAVPKPKQLPHKESPPPSLEEVCNNLPIKQDWESSTKYIQKCEKTVMSRMLQSHSVDFYWNMRRESTDWHHRVNTNQIMNRFARSLFTSKEGLNLLLQQLHWHCQPGVASVNFPRCYTLGFPDHYNNFIDDFRITACVSLLKWLVKKYEEEDEYAIKSPEGRVPHTALQFALDRCNEYVACKKHLDIDRDFAKVWNHEWDQFLSHYYLIVYEKVLFVDTNEWTLPLYNAAARTTLTDMGRYWPMINVDGIKNIWILKPGNKCRGRGILLVKHLEDVAKIMNMKLKYVVQKYIEKPLLIHDTKFDIRQWFLITSTSPLIIWMYRECYLRFSSQIFSLENFHESLHLTNHAVQCKYANVLQRSKELPDHNMWDSETFKTYLNSIGHNQTWEEVIYPGMRENIVGAMLACQDTMDRRPNTFELYGADFILTEDFRPWLLEINSSPDLSSSTKVTSRLCPQCLNDLVKVIVDRRRDPSSDTGSFECVYKQIIHRPPAYLGMSLSIRGRKIFKSKKAKAKDQKEKENNEVQQKAKLITANKIPSDIIPRCLPKMLSPDLYKGPVIGDLIEEIHQSMCPVGVGYEFIPARKLSPPLPKKKNNAVKHERVSKANSSSPRNKINKNSVNRKLNAKETSKIMELNHRKTRSMFIKSAYFGLLNEWKSKNKLALNSYPNFIQQNDNNNVWDKDDNSNILKGKNILTKLNVHDSNSLSINKTNVPPAYCLSSVNLSLSLPYLHKIEPQYTLNNTSNNLKSEPVTQKKSVSAKNILFKLPEN